MVQITGLSMQYATKKLFENVNLKLDKGKRYGLIGANGAGKSTFLKILSGEIEPTSGDISFNPNARLGVLGQNQFAFEDFSIKDCVLYGNKRLYDAIKEKEKLYEAGDFSDEVNERLGELEMICAEEDPTYEYDVQIEKILEDLGFSATIHNELMSTLTGGDKFKVLLAQVLFPKPDILFLDEPTNNLDLRAISYLEEQLKRHEGTLVVISHDRHFLNSVCTHILDLDFRSVREFSGNYDDWYIASTLIAKQQEAERNKKLKEKEELESFIARFSANASKAKQATSRQKQLEKLDIMLTEQSIDTQSQVDNYKTAATEQLSSKFDSDVATLQEQLQAGSITQEQYQMQYLELQQAYNEGVKQVEEVVADGIIDFDEISKEGQRISQELNKAKTEKEMWETLQQQYKQDTQTAAQTSFK